MGMIEILKRRHDAIFIQSESSEYYHADSARPRSAAPKCSTRCASSALDLNYGRRVDSGMYQYLLDNGMTREEYEWFLEHRLKQHCIFGNDYYQLNEHRVFADGHTVAAGETFGYAEITRQYYNRYRLPVMHTETNLWEGPHGDEAVKWLWKEWANVLRLRNVGIPTVGFTWYSLTDQVDWDTALREQNGNVNPLGLFDLDRKIRNVGKAYKQLIADWRNVLPAQSVCLIVPIKKISEHPDETMTMPPAAGSAAAARRPNEADRHERAQDRQDRDLLRAAALAVRPRRERRRRVRLGRSEPRRLGRGGRRRVRGLSATASSAPTRSRIEDIWQVGYRGGFYRGGAVLMSALSGLEQALWDLKGRVLGLPAWQMLGGKVRDKVRSYAWIGGDRPHEIGEAAAGRKKQGFNAVKMNATAELDWIGTPQAVRRRGEARRGGAGAGHGRRARLPRPRPPAARQAARQGARAARACCSSRSRCCPRTWRGCREIAALVSTPIALGERLYTPLGVQAVLRAGRGRHHPARPQPRRRNPRGAQDRGDGRSL